MNLKSNVEGIRVEHTSQMAGCMLHPKSKLYIGREMGMR